jgi:predicted alpha/beta hydrolase
MLAEFGIDEKPAGPNGEMGYLRADFEPVWKAMGIRP